MGFNSVFKGLTVVVLVQDFQIRRCGKRHKMFHSVTWHSNVTKALFTFKES